MYVCLYSPGKARFSFTCLLHSYLRVDHIKDTRVSGLEGRPYTDKVLHDTHGASNNILGEHRPFLGDA